MASASSALQQCFDRASTASQQALRRCLDQTLALLRDAEAQTQKQAERAEFGEACREITAHGGQWCDQYPLALRRAFSEALHPKPAAPANSPAHFGELTLVDDQQIVDAIESSRLLQHVLPLVERPVSELDALVSSAIGHETVRPELNPLRPEVFARALRCVLAANAAEGGGPAKLAWMRYLAEPLGRELQAIYAQLVGLLRNANVQAAGYRVSIAASSGATPSRPSPLAAADSSSGNGAGRDPLPAEAGSGYPVNLSSRDLSRALLRDFLVHGLGAEASQAPPQSYYAAVEQELAELKAQRGGDEGPAPLPEDYRALPAVDRPTRDVGVQSALDAQVWGRYAGSRERSLVRTQLRRDATRVGQVLGLELVRKVVDQVAQDPRLLAPVREAIVALEPSLLRLAMLDPRFFSDETHAARQLMERVAQRSFKYNDEFATEFARFFAEVGERFNALNQLPGPDAQPFQHALEQLEAGWLRNDSQEAEQQQPAMSAVLFAERRQAEADQIAWKLSSRPDLENVPNVVQDFLFGPWALVMAHARLTDRDHRVDPEGYAGVITDLLWSVKREVTLKQPAQLFRRLPSLLATLRQGLAAIGQDPVESEFFFQALMKLHHPVLKLRRARSRQDAMESGSAPLLPMLGPDVPQPAGAKLAEGLPWMSARELDAAGFEETLPTDMAELAEASSSRAAPLEPSVTQAAQPVRPARAAAPNPDEVLAELREGCWVDLYSKRRWRRAQLVWASSKGTLFMFVSHGGRPHSMTQRICRRLIEERFLRPVHTQEVVAKALESLEREAGADAAAQTASRPSAPGLNRAAPRSRPAALAG